MGSLKDKLRYNWDDFKYMSVPGNIYNYATKRHSNYSKSDRNFAVFHEFVRGGTMAVISGFGLANNIPGNPDGVYFTALAATVIYLAQISLGVANNKLNEFF